mmetsp:Transcript_3270/g.5022  ORF Transcript_3270/g.5022 Transcript_3270/m.5022 type:complete len:97 (+) Transcript_3270:491-781(+)
MNAIFPQKKTEGYEKNNFEMDLKLVIPTPNTRMSNTKVDNQFKIATFQFKSILSSPLLLTVPTHFANVSRLNTTNEACSRNVSNLYCSHEEMKAWK